MDDAADVVVVVVDGVGGVVVVGGGVVIVVGVVGVVVGVVVVVVSDNRGVFGRASRTDLSLRPTCYSSSLVSVWNRLCLSSDSSKKWSRSVNSGISAHTFLITFGLFIVSYLFAFSSNSFGCFFA